ncbi:DUF4158 domain-containing protein [Pseudonocardia asaccharolytica]|uniref:DUF4158 domain-containing protein n=1 Tax=Pseudonocardia asaccharolytica TaxID=54010 RepID=UPI001FE0E4AE|nr:DUF4158 domain-containing protein [Pseudonocardia asaccharolytica]
MYAFTAARRIGVGHGAATSRAPEQRRSSPSTSKTSPRPTSAPASSPKAARPNGSAGSPAPPSCCRACSAGGSAGRCSSPSPGDQQAAAYGRFVEEPARPELERFFLLDDMDRDLIVLRRTTAHHLGFAVQMCTVRNASAPPPRLAAACGPCATRPPPTSTRRDEPQVCSSGGGTAVRGASPLREELVRPQRMA